MILHCPNRKCNTTTDHKLKVATDEAICMTCGEVNDKLTDSMKKTMKSIGDVVKDMPIQKAFTFKCSKCGLNRGVKLTGKEAVCDTCLYPLGLSTAMVEAVKQSGNYTKDVSPESVKDVVKRKKS